MNRRSFFNSLAAFAGAASLSPHIFIPKFEPVKWKAITNVYETKHYVFNPADYAGEWFWLGLKPISLDIGKFFVEWEKPVDTLTPS